MESSYKKSDHVLNSGFINLFSVQALSVPLFFESRSNEKHRSGGER